MAEGVAGNFFDSTRAMTRVSVQMADVGTLEMRELLDEVRPRVDSIFPPEKYGLIMTGTSVAFLEGTTYMVKNLGISIALAIWHRLMMASLFKSSRMVAIALVPNLFPPVHSWGHGMVWHSDQAVDGFGIQHCVCISVDDTIHFLAKYRQELNMKSWNIRRRFSWHSRRRASA